MLERACWTRQTRGGRAWWETWHRVITATPHSRIGGKGRNGRESNPQTDTRPSQKGCVEAEHRRADAGTTLATETRCCSMASSRACCSEPILSNSSMQTTPWSPSTSAPACDEHAAQPAVTPYVCPFQIVRQPTWIPRIHARVRCSSERRNASNEPPVRTRRCCHREPASP
jgi:hypothetical protein